MTKMFLSSIIIFITFFMMTLNNPLSMGLMILFQTLLICMLSGMLIKTYWFSYILFLTFMGGLLVLFIYVSSIASNELFKPSFNSKLTFLLFIILLFTMCLYKYNNMYWMNLSFNTDMINLFNFNNFFNNKMNLSKLYNNQTFMIMLMLMIYLFITLIVVVKITNIFFGPIRSSI